MGLPRLPYMCRSHAGRLRAIPEPATIGQFSLVFPRGSDQYRPEDRRRPLPGVTEAGSARRNPGGSGFWRTTGRTFPPQGARRVSRRSRREIFPWAASSEGARLPPLPATSAHPVAVRAEWTRGTPTRESTGSAPPDLAFERAPARADHSCPSLREWIRPWRTRCTSRRRRRCTRGAAP